MKKLIFILALVLASQVSSAQIIKIKVYSVSQYVNGWSSWKDSNILGTIDLDKERVTIYSKEPQVFDIVRMLEDYKDKDGDEVVVWLSLDQDGLRVHLRFIKFRNSNIKHLYIEYDNITTALSYIVL
jgi:hypothetical protein